MSFDIEDVTKQLMPQNNGLFETDSMMGTGTSDRPTTFHVRGSLFKPQGGVGVERPVKETKTQTADHYPHYTIAQAKDPGMNAESLELILNLYEDHHIGPAEPTDQTNIIEEVNLSSFLVSADLPQHEPSLLKSPFLVKTG